MRSKYFVCRKKEKSEYKMTDQKKKRKKVKFFNGKNKKTVDILQNGNFLNMLQCGKLTYQKKIRENKNIALW